MNEIDIANITDESRFQHMKTLINSLGWQILIYELAKARERIINEGKSARADEKRVKNWARLDGFDFAATMAERILKASQAVESVQPVLEDD